MTKFPAALDDGTTLPTSTASATFADMGGGVRHTQDHTNANDAIKALEAKVGVDGSAVPTTLDHRIAALEAALAAAPTIPSGLIAMWAGTLASIPAGWRICDGLNGTPDLRDKFVKGAAATADAGATGGSATHTPAGTNSVPTFTGSQAFTSAVSAGTPAGAVAAPLFTGTSATLSHAGVAVADHAAHTHAFTPAGAVAWPVGAPTISGVAVADHASHTHTLTATGTVSWPAAVPTFAGAAGTVPAHTITWPASPPTFAGSALPAHAHELPLQIVSATSARLLTSATFGVGTSRAAGGAVTATANTTAAAVALSESKSAGTPAGVVAWPAAVPTMGTVSFTPAGAVAWPAGAPTFAGTSSQVTSGPSAALSHAVTQGTASWPAGTPAFTGTAGVTGGAALSHAVTQANDHAYTPAGTLNAPAFTGSALPAHAHALTPAGNVTAPTFTGAAANTEPAYYAVLFIQKV